MILKGCSDLLFSKIKSACADIFQVFWRQGKGLTDLRPYAINPATIVLAIMSRTMPTASAAPDALSAPLGLPLQDLLFLQVPEDPPSNPSISHTKPAIVLL
jgi:hypothetical protein